MPGQYLPPTFPPHLLLPLPFLNRQAPVPPSPTGSRNCSTKLDPTPHLRLQAQCTFTLIARVNSDHFRSACFGPDMPGASGRLAEDYEKLLQL